MSEYAHSRSQHQAAQRIHQEGLYPLFDDEGAQSQEVVDYDSVLDGPLVPTEAQPTEGASIRLTDRAVAVNGVIDAINTQNKYLGAAKTFTHSSKAEMLRGMQRNADIAKGNERQHLETLVAADALRLAGFGDDWQASVRRVVRDEIARDAQPGKAPHRRREKMRSKANRSARNSLK